MLPPLSLTAPAYVAAACTGSDLEITSVVPKRAPDTEHANYKLKVTVINHGAGQGGNVLQSVVMKQDGAPTERKGIPPLKSGQSYTYSEHFIRAVDSQAGSTEFSFVLVRTSPPLGSSECLGPAYKLSV